MTCALFSFLASTETEKKKQGAGALIGLKQQGVGALTNSKQQSVCTWTDCEQGFSPEAISSSNFLLADSDAPIHVRQPCKQVHNQT